MDRVPVSSSNLQSVGYSADSSTLEIEFIRGGVYQYFDVPQGEHEGLMSSDSKGKYFLANIKNRYPYLKL